MKLFFLAALASLMILGNGVACSMGVVSKDADDPGTATVKGLKEVGSVDFGNEENGLTLYENKLPKVKATKVTKTYHDGREDWEKKQPDTLFDAACKEFTSKKPALPTSQDMKTFFEKAFEITRTQNLQQMIWFPCRAEGTITFVDGSSGNWAVWVSGFAWLGLKDGQQGYFYCPECNSPSFDLIDMGENAKITFHKK